MIRHKDKQQQKTDMLRNVKGKEMGISGVYRLEYMPLMIQNFFLRIAMIGWAFLLLLSPVQSINLPIC